MSCDFAFAVPVMAFILIIVVTLGPLFYTYIGVVSAARAGAQYGSNSVITAADISGMKAAAKQDGAKNCLPYRDCEPVHLRDGKSPGSLSLFLQLLHERSAGKLRGR
jgi:hypothetical protein